MLHQSELSEQEPSSKRVKVKEASLADTFSTYSFTIHSLDPFSEGERRELNNDWVSWLQLCCGNWIWSYRPEGAPQEFYMDRKLYAQPVEDGDYFVVPPCAGGLVPKHGDLLRFNDYRGTETYVLQASHEFTPHSFYAWQTQSEYGYVIPVQASDAPLTYYNNGPCPIRTFWLPMCDSGVKEEPLVREHLSESQFLIYDDELEFSDCSTEQRDELLNRESHRLKVYFSLTCSLVWHALGKCKRLPRSISDMIATLVPTVTLNKVQTDPPTARRGRRAMSFLDSYRAGITRQDADFALKALLADVSPDFIQPRVHVFGMTEKEEQLDYADALKCCKNRKPSVLEALMRDMVERGQLVLVLSQCSSEFSLFDDEEEILEPKEQVTRARVPASVGMKGLKARGFDRVIVLDGNIQIAKANSPTIPSHPSLASGHDSIEVLRIVTQDQHWRTKQELELWGQTWE